MLDRSAQPVFGWLTSLIVLGLVFAIGVSALSLAHTSPDTSIAFGLVLVSPVVVSVLMGAAPALWRCISRWPGRRRYAIYLLTTPWEHGKPLPLGSPELSVGDVLLAIAAGLLCLYFDARNAAFSLALPTMLLLLAHNVCRAVLLNRVKIDKRYERAVALAFLLLPLSIVLPSVLGRMPPVWLTTLSFLAGQIAWYVVLARATAATFAKFPWPLPIYWVPEQKINLHLATLAVDWPFNRMSPHAVPWDELPPAQWRERNLLAPALVTSVIYAVPLLVWWYLSGSAMADGWPGSTSRDTVNVLLSASRWPGELPILGLIGHGFIMLLCAWSRAALYLRGTRSPLPPNPWHRIRRGRLISWQYSQAWIVPLCIAAGSTLLYAAGAMTPLPLVLVGWLSMYLGLVALYATPPTSDVWRLTGNAVEARPSQPAMVQTTSTQQRGSSKSTPRKQTVDGSTVIHLGPRTAYIILAVVFTCMFAFGEYQIMFHLDGLSPHFHHLVRFLFCVATLCTFLIMIGAKRLYLVPSAKQNWLASTPWKPGRRLPDGPMHPAWYEVLFVTPYAIWLVFAPNSSLATVAQPFVSIAIAWSLLLARHLTEYYWRTHGNPWRLQLAICTWPLVLFSLPWPWLTYGWIALSYALLQYDAVRVMRDFPAGTNWWRGLANPKLTAEQIIPAVPWPHNMLSPATFDEPRHSFGRVLCNALVVGWLAFGVMFILSLGWKSGALQQTPRQAPDWQLFLLLLTLVVFAIAMWHVVKFRICGIRWLAQPDDGASPPVFRMTVCNLGGAVDATLSPPMGVAGRRATGRMFTSFDQCWLLPFRVAAIVWLLGGFCWFIGLPFAVIVAILVSVHIILSDRVKARVWTWRYTSDWRGVRPSEPATLGDLLSGKRDGDSSSEA